MKKHFKILIVDDEKSIRELLLRILSFKNFGCQGAEDGEEALEIIRNGEFDLIISDIDMPKMGGVEMAQKINSFKIPIIFMSGRVDSLEKARLANLSNHVGGVEKPFSMKSFLEIIKKTLA